MSQSLAPIKNSSEFYLKALSGKLKGTVFRLSSKEIFIGRDPSNHIAIPNDPKLSRKHARFILNNGKYYIQNISSSNFIKINNEKVSQAELKNNFVLNIGEQSFKFISVGASTLATASARGGAKKSSRPQKPSLQAQDKAKKNRVILYVVVGLIGLSALYITFNDPVQKEKQKLREIATTESILESIEKETKKNEELLEENEQAPEASETYKKAHRFYIKGFRDFQKGLYSLALSSFETCLSIYPEHLLARRYNELAKNRLEELIVLNMNQGKVNLENGKYGFCLSSFKNAMAQINDKTDARYKEAKALYKRCELLKSRGY